MSHGLTMNHHKPKLSMKKIHKFLNLWVQDSQVLCLSTAGRRNSLDCATLRIKHLLTNSVGLFGPPEPK